MEGVEDVRQLDDQRLHWRATVAGKTQEWDAVITEQLPDKRVAWRSLTSDTNAGVVTFYYLSPETTRVMLQLDYEPRGAVEQVGSLLGQLDRQVKGDLERFKRYIEQRGTETGSWRGTIVEHPDLSQP
jgi:uncharacterized membrane protein